MIVPILPGTGQETTVFRTDFTCPSLTSSHPLQPPPMQMILITHLCQGPSSGMGIFPGNFTRGGDSACRLQACCSHSCSSSDTHCHGYPSPIAVFQFLLGKGNRQPLCPFCFFQKLIRILEYCFVLLSLYNDSPRDAKSLYITDEINHLQLVLCKWMRSPLLQ